MIVGHARVFGCGSFGSVLSQTLNEDNANWNGFNLRQYIAHAALTDPALSCQSKATITVRAGVAEGLKIGALRIGHSNAGVGDNYDFAGTPAQALSAGNASVTIAAGGTAIYEADFVYNKTSGLLIAAYFNDAANDTSRRLAGLSTSNYIAYFKSGSDETATQNVSGYSPSAGTLIMVEKIEMDGF
jgi:hypothetical protein